MTRAVGDELSTFKMVQLDPHSAMKKDVSYVASSQSGVKWPQFLAGSFAAGGALCSGAIMGWTLMQDNYNYTSNRTAEEQASNEDSFLVASLLTLGALQGALPAGLLADILGRKLLLLLMAGIFWIGGVLPISAPHVAWLVYTARFLSGFASGCVSVVIPLYNEEIAEVNVRGTIGVMYEMHFWGGVLLSCLMHMLFPNCNVPILHFLLPVIFLATFLWMPESPVYLVARGKQSKARKSVHWLRTSKSHPLYDVDAEVHTITTFLDNTRFKKHSKYYEAESGNKMLCCGNRKGSNILIVCILMLLRPLCGFFAVLSYRNIFSEVSDLPDNEISVIAVIFMFTSNIVSQKLVDRVGRRELILWSLGGTTICQAFFAQYFFLYDRDFDVEKWSWFYLVLFVAFLILFSVGLGPMPWLLMAEYLPAESKRWSPGLAAFINWLMLFLVLRAFNVSMIYVGHSGTFGLLFIINVLGVIFATLFFPETKGRCREEIQ